jgi:hypothetical protein
MANIRLQNGSAPPFGAEVRNERQQQVGILDGDGSVYLLGIKAGERMHVSWDGQDQCDVVIPTPLPDDLFNNLLLPCHSMTPIALPQAEPEVTPMLQLQTHLQPSAEPETLSSRSTLN